MINLSDNVMMSIFKYMDWRDILKTLRISRRFNNLKYNNRFMDMVEEKFNSKINTKFSTDVVGYDNNLPFFELNSFYSNNTIISDNTVYNNMINDNVINDNLISDYVMDYNLTLNTQSDDDRYKNLLKTISKYQSMTNGYSDELKKIKYIIDISKLTNTYNYHLVNVASIYSKPLFNYNIEVFLNVFQSIVNNFNFVIDKQYIHDTVDCMIYLGDVKDIYLVPLMSGMDDKILTNILEYSSRSRLIDPEYLLRLYKFLYPLGRQGGYNLYTNNFRLRKALIKSVMMTPIIKNKNNSLDNLRYYIENCDDNVSHLLDVMSHNCKELADIIGGLLCNKDLGREENEIKYLRTVLNINYYLPYQFDKLKYGVVHILCDKLIKIIIKNKDNVVFMEHYLPYIQEALEEVITNGSYYKCKCNKQKCGTYNHYWMSYTGMTQFIVSFFPYMWEEDKIQCLKKISSNYEMDIFEGQILSYMNMGKIKYEPKFLEEFKKIEMNNEFKFNKQLLI